MLESFSIWQIEKKEEKKITELSQCSVIYYLNLKFKAKAMIEDNDRELNDIK